MNTTFFDKGKSLGIQQTVSHDADWTPAFQSLMALKKADRKPAFIQLCEGIIAGCNDVEAIMLSCPGEVVEPES